MTLSDINLELLSFLGTDLGASVAAEIGEEAVGEVFLAGAFAQSQLDLQSVRSPHDRAGDATALRDEA